MIGAADQLVLAAGLGVSFWDVAGGGFVSDSLRVSAYPPARAFARVSGVCNRSGVFVFHHLPGLLGFERGMDPSFAWSSPPAAEPFVLEVADATSRFLPISLALTAPARSRLVFTCDPRLPARPAVPLYSAPGRQPPAGLAVVRAQLQVASSGAPAAWAVIDLDVAGQANAARGIADADGQVVVLFPYPEPAGLPIGSPGAASGPPLADQSWSIRAHLRYDGLPPGPPPPDLCAIVNQSPARLWADLTGSAELGPANLLYGRELILRSTTAGSPASIVLIGPAGSPP